MRTLGLTLAIVGSTILLSYWYFEPGYAQSGPTLATGMIALAVILLFAGIVFAAIESYDIDEDLNDLINAVKSIPAITINPESASAPRVSGTCPACGTQNSSTASYCIRCGRALK